MGGGFIQATRETASRYPWRELFHYDERSRRCTQPL